MPKRPKRRPRPRPRNKAVLPSVLRPQGPVTEEEINSLPLISGPLDDGRARSYLERFAHFEAQLLGDTSDVAVGPGSIPAEYEYLTDNWGEEALHFFRPAMWSYLEQHLHINPWTTAITSLLRRANRKDPTGYEEFAQAAEDATVNFLRKETERRPSHALNQGSVQTR
jgi:hypothetical protein